MKQLFLTISFMIGVISLSFAQTSSLKQKKMEKSGAAYEAMIAYKNRIIADGTKPESAELITLPASPAKQQKPYRSN